MTPKIKIRIEIFSDIIAALGIVFIFAVILLGGKIDTKKAKAEPVVVETKDSLPSDTSSQLKGLINPNSNEIISRGFEWGLNNSYGNSAEDSEVHKPVYSKSIDIGVKPNQVAVKDDGTIAVLDIDSNKIITFSNEGNKLFEIGGDTGSGNYQFNSPKSLIYGKNGNLYVSDRDNARVQIYNSGLAYNGTIIEPSMVAPSTLTVDENENIYVLDSQAKKVFKFNKNYDIESIINYKNAENANSISVDDSSNIYISSDDGLQKLNANGDLVSTISAEKFKSLAINSINKIFALSENGMVKIFEKDGKYLSEFISGETKFSNPSGISINTLDQLAVADTDNSKVQLFSNPKTDSSVDFSVNINNLECDKEYHYRAFASTQEGIIFGNDAAFKTLPCGVKSSSLMSAMAVTVQTNDATGVGLDIATLNGEVTASTSPVTKRGFEWGTTSGSLNNYIAGQPTETSRKINPDSPPWAVGFQPTGIAIDKNSSIVYVSDATANKIESYNFSGGALGSYNPGTLSSPNGLAVDNYGYIYIADTNNNRIKVVRLSDSTQVAELGDGSSGSLSAPQGVALDTFGNIYVADTGNNMIKRYLKTTTPSNPPAFSYDAGGSFGSGGINPGQFLSPQGIAISEDGKNTIVVADTGNARFQVFEQAFSAPSTLTPNPLPIINNDGGSSSSVFSSTVSVAIDAKNNIYVADNSAPNRRVVVFDRSGNFISEYSVGSNNLYGLATYTQPNSNPANNDSLVFVTNQIGLEVEKLFTQGEFSAEAFSFTLDYLKCGTTYYFRATSADSTATYYGAEKSFTTTPCNTNITVTTLPPTNISGTFATLNGNVSAVGPDPALTIQGFQWGSTTAYGNVLNNQPASSTATANTVELATQWSSGLNVPIDVATDNSGYIYVSDYVNNKIKKYNNNGGFVASWDATQPKGIAVKPGVVWVVTANGISKYNSNDGSFLADFSYGIGATDVAADMAGNMYATFPAGYILAMDPAGNPTNVFGYYNSAENNLGYFPTGIDVKDYGSGNGVIYVSDTTNNRVMKYTLPFGNPGGSISSFGSEKGYLILPGYLTIDQDDEEVYVTDSTGSLSKFNAVGTQTFYKSTVVNMPYGNSIGSIISGVATDISGNVFITSTNDNLVKKYFQRTTTNALGDYSRVLGLLNCGSTYYYRAYANSVSGDFFGSGQSVTTTACSLIPSIANPIPFGTFPIGVFTNPQTTGASAGVSGDGQAISQGGGRSGIGAAIDNALQGILNITKRIPRDVAVAIPFLLILIILFFALIYAIQSYRELKSTERYNVLIEKYDNLQFGSKNFISLTNHYLNTPISIMQLSIGLMVSENIISKEKSEQITSLIRNITDSVHELLEKNAKTTEKFMSEINPHYLKNKVKKASFNPLAWIPIIIAGGLVILANLLFLRADVFKFNFTSLIVQVGLFVLSALFIILSLRSLRRNREIRKQRVLTLQKEKELSLYKINFINEASNSIDKNIGRINEIANEFKSEQKATSFLRGVAMLSGVQKSFELLKKFSAFSPSGNIDENDVSEVLNKILERQAKVMARKNVRIKTNVANELNMRLDKSALILLLGSTINNAVKFSRNNGTIYVNIENKLNGTKISIKDEGIGIPKDKIDQLMMPFTRASDAMHYDYEGLGLGLYLDRIIIEQVGGSVKISSELGKGTTVEFNVPRGIKLHKSEVKISEPIAKPA